MRCASSPSATGPCRRCSPTSPGMAYRCANDSDWTSMNSSATAVAQLTGYAPHELLGDVRRPSYGDIIVARGPPAASGTPSSALRAPRALDASRTASVTKDGRDTLGLGTRRRGAVTRPAPSSASTASSATSPTCAPPRTRCASASRCSAGSSSSLPGAAYRSDLLPPWRTSFLSEGFRGAARPRPGRVRRRAGPPGPTSCTPTTSSASSGSSTATSTPGRPTPSPSTGPRRER